MSKHLPPLNWFRAFEAAARHLSFTSAAEEIGMTQSAVSQQIKALETRLGVPLFERKPRGLALTDDGRRLLPEVDAALEKLTSATRAYQVNDHGQVLTVSVSVSIFQWIISPALGELRARHPDLVFRFVGAIWPDDFNQTVADVIISFGSRKQAGPGGALLGSDQLIALAPTSGDIAWNALPVIETVGTSGGWNKWMAVTGMRCAAPTIYVDSYGAALDLAANGNGICLVNETLAAPVLADGRVTPVTSVTVKGHEAYFLDANTDVPEAIAFCEWLQQLV